jgi:hypothetical protein
MRRMDPDDPTTSGLLLPNSMPQMVQPVPGYQLGIQMRRPARSIPPPAPILALLVQIMSLPAGMLQPLVSGVTMCPTSQSPVIVCSSLCRAASCMHHQPDRRHLAALCELFVIGCMCRAASCVHYRLDRRHLAAPCERFAIVYVCTICPHDLRL